MKNSNFQIMTGIVNLGGIDRVKGDIVPGSVFTDSEHLQFHLDNGGVVSTDLSGDSDNSGSELSTMSASELKAKATELGLTFSGNATKVSLVEMIQAKLDEDSE